jgi:hypothetical protein
MDLITLPPGNCKIMQKPDPLKGLNEKFIAMQIEQIKKENKFLCHGCFTEHEFTLETACRCHYCKFFFCPKCMDVHMIQREKREALKNG